MIGGATLVRWLPDRGPAGRVDLLVDPVVVGRGRRLFPEEPPAIPPTVAASQMFGSGAHHVVYAVGTPLDE